MPYISYDCPAGPLPAYLAVPAGADPRAGVVVIHDALGLTADLRRITDRFAANGYLAMAPALYRRGNRIRCVVRTLRALSEGSGDAVTDVIAARERLATDARCTGKIGCVGFCMGGGFCLLLAPLSLFDAAAPNYGIWPKDVDRLGRSCPVVASYGQKDRWLPNAAEKLDAALAVGDVPRDIKEYPAVGHSFMNDWGTPHMLRGIERLAGMAYSEPEAEDSWQRILAFFDTHLR